MKIKCQLSLLTTRNLSCNFNTVREKFTVLVHCNYSHLVSTQVDWLQWDSGVEWTGYSGTERLSGLVVLSFDNKQAEKLNLEQIVKFTLFIQLCVGCFDDLFCSLSGSY